jgi:hypothetical protein
MVRYQLLCALGAILFASLSQAAPLVIVDQGQPKATIVVAADEPKAAMAAGEIQKYVELISRAKLPLVKEGEEPAVAGGSPPISIFVGHTQAAKKLGIKIPSGYDRTIRPDFNEEEGYVLRAHGNAIVVAGNSDGPYKGTLYAAYALLEKLGCRWYFPGAFGEVIPEAKTISVPEFDITSKPDFALRNIWMDGRWGATLPDRAAYNAWGTRIGFSDNRMYPTPGDGYLAYALTPKEYAAAHPEWFAMNKQGVRDVKPTTPMQNAMLCLSNPQMFDEYVKNIKEAFAGKRKIASVTDLGIGISPPDGAPFCYCDQCLAASQDFNYPTYVQERMQSEEMFGFGAKLADLFPDKWVSISAYSLREMPPQGLKLRPNMTAMVAPISSCVLHPMSDPSCWRRQETLKILTEWRRLTPHVWLYDYTPGFLVSGFEPEAELGNFAINAPIYKQIGIKGFGRQGSNAMMATWLGYYAAGKFMWDVHSDLGAIKDDFYGTFFGPDAGPHVRAWWDACEEVLRTSKMHAHESWLVNHLYTVEFARSIHKHLDAARAAKMTDKQRERLHAFELIVENFEASTEMEEAGKNLDYKKAAACAERMLAARDALNKISVFLIGKGAQTHPSPLYTRGRMNQYLKLAAMTGGETGTLAAELPLMTRFSRDRFNEGVVARWFQPGFDDSKWGMENTYYTWEQQDPAEDSMGHDYDGYGWYRATIEIPAAFQGKPLHFYSGGAINEAWVWVNGEYAGHRPAQLWWAGNLDFDLDVTKLVKPGQKNTIAIRVWNNTDVGGLYRRGFFWSPNPTNAATPKP